MAGGSERLALLITGDGSGAIKELRKVGDAADRELGRATSATEKWSKKFTATGAVLVAGSAVAAAGLYKLGTAASDLNETVNKTTVVFGDSSDAVLEWSKTSATALGQSQRQALDAASGFAAFGKAAGLGGQELVGFSTRLVKLATDFASFQNTSPQEAITAIGAALRGENEPIRQYGVLLDDATLRQEALRQGLVKTTKEALTPQTRVLAAYQAILKQSGDSLDDFRETSDGAANQQKILKAQFDDLKAGIGQGVLPVMNQLLGGLNSVTSAFTGLSPETQKTAGSIAAVATAAAGTAGGFALAAGGIIKGTRALREFASTAPLAATAAGGLGIALAGITGALVAFDQLGGAAPDVERLTTAANAFAESGLFEGALAESFGVDADKIGQRLAEVDELATGFAGVVDKIGSVIADPFSSGAGATEISRAQKVFASWDETLVGLVQSGNFETAARLFDYLKKKAVEQGRTMNELVRQLPRYVDELDDASLTQRSAAATAGQLDDAWASNRRTALDAASAVDRVRDAQEDLADARADVAGTGERALAAARREADAQRGLSDAYESSADAAERLTEARKALVEFDAAEATNLRALEREQILRRRIGSAEEARQKEIDLAKFDQSSAKERERLQEGVADAEDGVADAAQRVTDAQRDVSDAAKERRDVQIEAAQQVEAAERDVELAALAVYDAYQKALEEGEGNVEVANLWKGALEDTAKLFAPGSDLRTGLGMMLAATNPMGPFLPPAGWVPATATAAAPPLSTANRGVGVGPGGGGGGGSWRRAAGGPVSAGNLYRVNEQGLEYFRPNVNGTIIPMGAGGDGVAINQVVHFHGGDIPTVTQLDAQNRKLGIRVALSGRRG